MVISPFEVPGLCPFIKKGQLMWVLCCNFSFLWTNALSNLHNILNHITQGKFYFSYYAFTVPKLCPHAESRSKLHHMISFFNYFFLNYLPCSNLSLEQNMWGFCNYVFLTLSFYKFQLLTSSKNLTNQMSSCSL